MIQRSIKVLDRNGNLTLSGLVNNLAADIDKYYKSSVNDDNNDLSNFDWVKEKITNFILDNNLRK